MPGIEHADVSYDVLHFAQVFPVRFAECGRRGPATPLWQYVSCLDCLATAPDTPVVRARIAELRARVARSGPEQEGR